MKKTNLIMKSLLAAILLLIGVSFTSCVADSDEAIPAVTGEGSLVINIRPSSVGATTRSVTELTASTSADELTIQNMVVGVFRKDDTSHNGELLALEEYTGINASAAAGYSRLTNLEDAVNHFAVGDEVLVAINLPESVRNTLKNKTNIATRKKFLAVFDGTNNGISIDQALTQQDDYSDPTACVISASCLPMFGEATITQATKSDNQTLMNHSFKADINVIHMVSKITLRSVTFNIIGNGSASSSDTFTLQEAFLINVPTMLDFSFDSGNTFATQAGTAFTGSYDFARQNANIFQGWTDDCTKDADHLDTNSDNTIDVDKAYRDYLGTGVMTDEVTSMRTGQQANHSYVLYTMPNNSTTANTRLVIKAAYNGTEYYYPIDLLNNVDGNLSTDTKIYPNRNYVVDVIIKGVGALGSAYGELGVQQTTQSNVNVQNWTTSSNSTDFDPTDW